MRKNVVALALVLTTVSSPVAADVYVPPARLSLAVGLVRAMSGDAPDIDRDAAVERVRQGVASLLPRVQRCLEDATPDWEQRGREGEVRFRLELDRSEAPTRAHVLESQIGAAGERCVAEILPSLHVRPAPRGTLTIQGAIVARRSRGW